jgi:hypothetical protein
MCNVAGSIHIPCIDPGWGTVVGGGFVMVAAAVTVGYSEWQRRRELAQRKQHLREAIHSEIKTLTRMIVQRDYVGHFRRAADQLARMDPAFSLPDVSIEGKYARVYEANLGQISLLGIETEDVVEFYSMLESSIDSNRQWTKSALRILAAGELSGADREKTEEFLAGLAAGIGLVILQGKKITGEDGKPKAKELTSAADLISRFPPATS